MNEDDYKRYSQELRPHCFICMVETEELTLVSTTVPLEIENPGGATEYIHSYGACAECVKTKNLV